MQDNNHLEIGSILEGSVIRLKPFGAIVSLPDNKQGLVHISHVSSKFIEKIEDHVSVGDVVKVKVIGIDDETKKISLSIKEAMPQEKKAFTPKPKLQKAPQAPVTFEDKLSDWLKDSTEKQATLNKRSKRR